MASKKRAAKKSAGKNATPTKAEFVRKFPDASPQEVLEEAKKAGIEMALQYVYNVRAADRTKKTATPKSKTAAAAKPVAKTSPAPKKTVGRKKSATRKATAGAPVATPTAAPVTRSSQGSKDRFIAAVLEIGLERASAILDAIRNA